MEFAPPNLNIARLKRKMDISGLTIQIQGLDDYGTGRFYLLWRNGIFLVIQAEPWQQPDPDVKPDFATLIARQLEDLRALWYLQEVIQTMLDTIVIDGENNWAYLIRPKDGTYRLVYKKRRWINNLLIWTKVVELKDIEMTRFVNGLLWEGVYQGQDVDLLIGWVDYWANFIPNESRGQMLVQSMGVGHYFFELKGHVSQNGVVVGVMMEPLVGRRVTPADRSAVFEAVADIQQHGITFLFQIRDIYITERGVRFASASSAKYCQDRDALAEEAKFTWQTLAGIFNYMDEDPLRTLQTGSRSMQAGAWIMPRLPSPTRPITMTTEDAMIRLVWSITTSDEFCLSGNVGFNKLFALHGSSGGSATRRDRRIKGDNRTLLPPDDSSGDLGGPDARIALMDRPIVITCGAIARWHPYARPKSKRLLLPKESDFTPVT